MCLIENKCLRKTKNSSLIHVIYHKKKPNIDQMIPLPVHLLVFKYYFLGHFPGRIPKCWPISAMHVQLFKMVM